MGEDLRCSNPELYDALPKKTKGREKEKRWNIMKLNVTLSRGQTDELRHVKSITSEAKDALEQLDLLTASDQKAEAIKSFLMETLAQRKAEKAKPPPMTRSKFLCS